MDKMAIWNAVSGTDPKYTSRVQQRGGFTAIDAYYQIHQATELWGPYGSTWGLRNMVRTLDREMEMAFLDAEFHYPDGETDASFPIANCIDMKTRSKSGDRWDDEFVKKLETNTISKALSRLGFGADVFMGLFDDNKYVEEQNRKYGNPLPEPSKIPGFGMAAAPQPPPGTGHPSPPPARHAPPMPPPPPPAAPAAKR